MKLNIICRRLCEVLAVDERMKAAGGLLLAPLDARLRRMSNVRPETFRDVARLWRQHMPGDFAIADPAAWLMKGGLVIAQPRIIASHWHNRDWGDGVAERGVTVTVLALIATSGRGVNRAGYKLAQFPAASVGMHAIARRIGRTAPRDTEAVARDLGFLIGADGLEDRVPATRGYWIGQMQAATNEKTGEQFRMRDVRTWADADMACAGPAPSFPTVNAWQRWLPEHLAPRAFRTPVEAGVNRIAT